MPTRSLPQGSLSGPLTVADSVTGRLTPFRVSSPSTRSGATSVPLKVACG